MATLPTGQSSDPATNAQPIVNSRRCACPRGCTHLALDGNEWCNFCLQGADPQPPCGCVECCGGTEQDVPRGGQPLTADAEDGESSGHTSYESDGDIQQILREVEAEEVKAIQRNHAQASFDHNRHNGQAWTTLSDALSTMGQAESDASESDESDLEQPQVVLAHMAPVLEGEEDEAALEDPPRGAPCRCHASGRPC